MAHLVLIGGDPGIGKSTLLLQVSSQLADKRSIVLYISGEESVKQTKLRADRLRCIIRKSICLCRNKFGIN